MINEYENVLRRLIINIIGKNDNSEYKVSHDRLEKWKEKRIIEHKKNKNVTYENRIIYYSDFYDLKTIIIKNWELFKPIFHDKKRFEIFFEELENYRNTISHGRNLTLSQENLLKGILLDLKTQITIFHNKNEMKEDYFIRLTKISDNLGNIWISDNSKPKPVLRVGDDYELLIEAFDPKNRTISYKIFTLRNNFNLTQISNRFCIKIDNNLVGQNVTFYIVAFTPEAEYKNEVTHSISMTILPQ